MAVTKPTAFNHVQVRVYCYTPTQISINVLDYVVREPVITGGATLQEMSNALSATWAGEYRAFMPSVARYRGCSVQDLSSPASIPYTNGANDGAGTNGDELAPTQVSGLIRKHTLSSGRMNRGRLYVGFPSKLDITATGGQSGNAGGKLQAIADIMDVTQTIVGAGGTTVLDLVVWHRGGAFNYTLCNQLSVATEWATQRKRGQFGRTNQMPF